MNKSLTRFVRFVIIIGIIGIVAFFIARHGIKMLNEKKYDDLETDLLLIQARVKVIKGKADVNANTDGFVGQKVSESNNEKIKKLLNNLQISEENYGNYYILSMQDFGTMGVLEDLKNKGDSLFIVNYEEGEVIYTKGIKVDGKTKYKLSDIIKKVEKKEWILHNRMLE